MSFYKYMVISSTRTFCNTQACVEILTGIETLRLIFEAIANIFVEIFNRYVSFNVANKLMKFE